MAMELDGDEIIGEFEADMEVCWHWTTKRALGKNLKDSSERHGDEDAKDEVVDGERDGEEVVVVVVAVV